MLDFQPTPLAYSDSLAPLRRFATEHRDALLHAAGLLGGMRGVRTAISVLDGLQAGRPASRSLRRDVDRLRALLHLDDVHDPDGVEAVCFAAFDPTDPTVEEICLLADGFDEAIAASEADAPDNGYKRRDLRVRHGQATATISARGVVKHSGRRFAVDTQRRQRPAFRGEEAVSIKTIRAGAK